MKAWISQGFPMIDLAGCPVPRGAWGGVRPPFGAAMRGRASIWTETVLISLRHTPLHPPVSAGHYWAPGSGESRAPRGGGLRPGSWSATPLFRVCAGFGQVHAMWRDFGRQPAAQ